MTARRIPAGRGSVSGPGRRDRECCMIGRGTIEELSLVDNTMAHEERRGFALVLQTADVRVVEYVLGPGDVHPWHYHSEVSDTFYCLEGLIGVETREPAATAVLRPGEKITVSPKVVHHVKNADAGQSRYLLLQGIGKYDFHQVE